jgi:hypothetical protein
LCGNVVVVSVAVEVGVVAVASVVVVDKVDRK